MAEALAECSALGTARGAAPRVIFESSALRIVEEPFLQILSLRAARARPRTAGLAEALTRAGLAMPAAANAISGDPQCAVAWLEPFAWLRLSAAVLPCDPLPGILVTDLSSRYAAFRLSGAAAREVLAAGCDPQILRPMSCARTRFGGFVTAQLQQWQDGSYRVLVDVSLGATMADWLKQAAGTAAGA